MAVKITKATPKAPSKFLILGEPFSGKTTLASKAPKPVFISTDGNSAKMGLDSIIVKTVADIREALTLAVKSKEYKTIVVDTIEGIVDIFTKELLAELTSKGMTLPDGGKIESLQDVPFGKATGMLNKRLEAFSEALAGLDQNVIVLSYTKRRADDITGAIVLESEFKGIRFFTKFMDAQILTFYDGENHKASVIHKREVAAGKVNFGDIEKFLTAAGWTLPKKSVKVGSTRGKASPKKG